ncbi:hypothetical protein [Stygiolobus caldivivus]|uniref:Uncharacterized protein n=1 Tax=Stygiolobus caldivivus TaxID=2824673 RepID=A0A8D5ZJ76_9CREN|nr:hypothetical protein [Stygiolobus caldivivus]BCU71279.1 hypothetical protein KN1_25760 [Stygiolobus caldivivus]
MKRIYLLGVVLLLFVVLGAIFYVENSNFYSYVELVKELKTPSTTTYTFCVVSVNKGPLPMSANILVAVSAGVQSGIIPHTQYYKNTSSIRVNPFSTEKSQLTVTIPNSLQVYGVDIEGSGNYGWSLKLTNNNTLLSVISRVDSFAKFYPVQVAISSHPSFSTNASIVYVTPHEIPYYIAPTEGSVIAYPNGTLTYSVDFILNTQYIKLLDGTYNLKLYVNNTLVNSTSSSIVQGQQVNVYGNLPPTYVLNAYNGDAVYNVTLYLDGEGLIYYFNELISI